MDTKISNTIRQWIPDAYTLAGGNVEADGTLSDYQLLRNISFSCLSKLDRATAKDIDDVARILKVINLLYQSDNQYIKHAIDNVFIKGIITAQSTHNFERHLTIFPPALKRRYLKIIFNN